MSNNSMRGYRASHMIWNYKPDWAKSSQQIGPVYKNLNQIQAVYYWHNYDDNYMIIMMMIIIMIIIIIIIRRRRRRRIFSNLWNVVT